MFREFGRQTWLTHRYRFPDAPGVLGKEGLVRWRAGKGFGRSSAVFRFHLAVKEDHRTNDRRIRDLGKAFHGEKIRRDRSLDPQLLADQRDPVARVRGCDVRSVTLVLLLNRHGQTSACQNQEERQRDAHENLTAS